MGTKNYRAARGTAMESANVREKSRCLSHDGIALGARPCRAKKAMLHRAWQAGRRPQRKLLPAACWIASLRSVAEMKGFFYGSSTQNAFIRIVRGALVAAEPRARLARRDPDKQGVTAVCSFSLRNAGQHYTFLDVPRMG